MVHQRAAEGVRDEGKDSWVGRRTSVVHGDHREDRDDDADPYPTTGEKTHDAGMASVRGPYLEVEVTSSRHVAAEHARPPSERENTMHTRPLSVESDCSTDEAAVAARRWKGGYTPCSMVNAYGRNSTESNYSI